MTIRQDGFNYFYDHEKIRVELSQSRTKNLILAHSLHAADPNLHPLSFTEHLD